MKDKIIGFILALLPVLSIYRVPGIDFPMGMIAIFIVMILLAVETKNKANKVSIVQKYGFFCVYAILVTIVFSAGFNNSLIGFIINSICVILLLRGGSYINSFLKVYVLLAVAFSLFLMFQYVSFLFFSNPISGILSFLPTEIGDEATSIRAYDYISVARISSVFTEPSHFALYVVFPLALLLWDYVVVKFRVWLIVLFTISILLSTSGNGMVLMLMIYVLYFIKKMQGKKAILVLVITAALIPIAFKVVDKVDAVQYTYNSLTEESDGDHSKSYYRVSRGFKVYAEMPFYTQIVGVGYHNSENFFKSFAPSLLQKYKIGDVIFDYYNSIAGILIYFGIIGFILMTSFLISIWRSSKQYGERVLLIVMFFSCISSSIFNSDEWFIYIALMVAISYGYLKNSENDGKNRYKQIA